VSILKLHPMTAAKANGQWPIRIGGSTGRVGYFGKTRRDSNGDPKMHKGVDFVAKSGVAVFAAHDGSIREDGIEKGIGGYEVGQGVGYGRRLYLRSGALETVYAHLSGQHASKGYKVRAGDLIGWIGRSGNVADDTEDHLHFEVKIEGVHVDPEKWLTDE